MYPHQATIGETVSDITRRLRPILADMPEPEFEDLVQQMATVQWKYRIRPETATPGWVPNGAASRPVAER